MQYLYAEKQNFEDLSSGRVIYQKAGAATFPIRLANEIFLRCTNYLEATGRAEIAAIADKMGLSGIMANTLKLMASKRRLFVLPQLLAGLRGLIDEGKGEVGRYKYEYDVATLLGDDGVHATSSIDYRDIRQMRMAATVYVADLGEENIDPIMEFYTQKYPPKDRSLLLNSAGAHWNPQNPRAKLPKPNATFLALQTLRELETMSIGHDTGVHVEQLILP